MHTYFETQQGLVVPDINSVSCPPLLIAEHREEVCTSCETTALVKSDTFVWRIIGRFEAQSSMQPWWAVVYTATVVGRR